MKSKYLLIAVFLLISGYLMAQPSNFGTSLHKTRPGKAYWYNTVENGGAGGFEILTNVPVDHHNLECADCHGSTNADGKAYDASFPYPGPSCNDCHPSNFATAPTESQCYTCHSRQNAEKSLYQNDVHRKAGLTCMSCHYNKDANVDDLHGDGTEYKSMIEPGAIKAECTDCHTAEKGTLPDHSALDPHNGKLSCDACHVESNIACFNCHFESQVENHLKRAKQQIKDFIILVNREKDGKVGLASFQSLSYQGDTWIAMGPYHGHTISENARGCTACHQNFGGQITAISDYNEDGILHFAKWNTSDSTLSWHKGVVPLPEDYLRSFKLDFITYNGSPSDPIAPSKNWSFVKDEADGFQLLFATPLTKSQMAKMGMDTTKTLTAVDDVVSSIPTVFTLEQNYPNPFNPTTKIKYSIAKETNVKLSVYDNLGKLVQTIVDKDQPVGNYEVEFNAENLSSGVYFYQLQTPQKSITKKLVIMK